MALSLAGMPQKCPSFGRLGVCLGQIVARMALGFFGGGLVGVAAGQLFFATERWEPVPLDRLSVGIMPLPAGRLGLGASLAF